MHRTAWCKVREKFTPEACPVQHLSQHTGGSRGSIVWVQVLRQLSLSTRLQAPVDACTQRPWSSVLRVNMLYALAGRAYPAAHGLAGCRERHGACITNLIASQSHT